MIHTHQFTGAVDTALIVYFVPWLRTEFIHSPRSHRQLTRHSIAFFDGQTYFFVRKKSLYALQNITCCSTVKSLFFYSINVKYCISVSNLNSWGMKGYCWFFCSKNRNFFLFRSNPTQQFHPIPFDSMVIIRFLYCYGQRIHLFFFLIIIIFTFPKMSNNSIWRRWPVVTTTLVLILLLLSFNIGYVVSCILCPSWFSFSNVSGGTWPGQTLCHVGLTSDSRRGWNSGWSYSESVWLFILLLIFFFRLFAC